MSMAIGIALISATVGGLVGWMIGGCQCHFYWEQDLIRRGHAEYNPKTGRWQWKDVMR